MYVKLFTSLYQGTLRGKPDEILVFTNLLAHADQHGIVDMHWQAIADETGLPRERVEAAIKYLELPDPESRSPDMGGCRIIKMDEHRAWGWNIVNYGKYRAIRNEDDRKEQNRLAQERFRSKHKSKQSKPPSAHTEADTEAEAYTKKEKAIGQNKFDLFWNMYPRKVKKKTASDIWKRKKLETLSDKPCENPYESLADRIINDVKSRIDIHRPWKEGFIPHPTTYLNGELWNDEIQVSDTKPEKKQVIIPNKDDHQAIDRLGRQLGIAAKAGEDYWTYRQRLIEAQK